MPFAFPEDSNSKAGAVKAIRSNTDFVVPVADVSGAAILLTNALLAGDAAYTQATQSRLAEMLVTKVKGYAFADQAGTLYVEEADVDGVWTQVKTRAVTANVFADTGWVYLTKKLFRFRYVNGAAIQTAFSLYQALGFGVADVQLTGSNFEQAPGSAIPSKAVLMGISDGTNIQAMKGNTEGTLLASAARTADTISSKQTNYNARGVMISLEVTNTSGTGGLKLRICNQSPQNSDWPWYLNNDPTVVTATGTYFYVLYPANIALAGSITQVTQLPLPRIWGVRVLHSDASSYTYSVGYSLIL